MDYDLGYIDLEQREPCPPAFADFELVAVGRAIAILEALVGVLQHQAMNMLGGLARLVLVKDVKNLANELAAAVHPDIRGERQRRYLSIGRPR
jgi:hypothetical protein